MFAFTVNMYWWYVKVIPRKPLYHHFTLILIIILITLVQYFNRSLIELYKTHSFFSNAKTRTNVLSSNKWLAVSIAFIHVTPITWYILHIFNIFSVNARSCGLFGFSLWHFWFNTFATLNSSNVSQTWFIATFVSNSPSLVWVDVGV